MSIQVGRVRGKEVEKGGREMSERCQPGEKFQGVSAATPPRE